MPLISVIAPNFPFAEEPYRGEPIYRTVLALQEFADVEVLCPVAVYPPWLTPRYRYHRPDLTYRPPGIRRIQYLEYPVFPVFTRPFNGRLCARRIYPELAQSRSDLMLAFWLYPDGYASVQVGRKLGKPVIVSARGSDLRRIQDLWTRRLVRRTLLGADAVLTVSEELRTQAIRLGADPQRTRAIPNGFDKTVFFHAPGGESRGQLEVRADEKVILFVGRLSEAKGLVELLNAFKSLAAEDEQLRLVCVGEGAFRPRIEEFAKVNGLERRVQLPGGRPPRQVALWMNAADVFCLPSYSEGCPNVVIEALACGCPVVATNVGGIPELIHDECGMLVPSRDAGQLTRALRAALARTWDRPRIAAQSTRGWNQVAAETIKVCRSVLGSRRKPPGEKL